MSPGSDWGYCLFADETTLAQELGALHGTKSQACGGLKSDWWEITGQKAMNSCMALLDAYKLLESPAFAFNEQAAATFGPGGWGGWWERFWQAAPRTQLQYNAWCLGDVETGLGHTAIAPIMFLRDVRPIAPPAPAAPPGQTKPPAAAIPYITGTDARGRGFGLGARVKALKKRAKQLSDYAEKRSGQKNTAAVLESEAAGAYAKLASRDIYACREMAAGNRKAFFAMVCAKQSFASFGCTTAGDQMVEIHLLRRKGAAATEEPYLVTLALVESGEKWATAWVEKGGKSRVPDAMLISRRCLRLCVKINKTGQVSVASRRDLAQSAVIGLLFPAVPAGPGDAEAGAGGWDSNPSETAESSASSDDADGTRGAESGSEASSGSSEDTDGTSGAESGSSGPGGPRRRGKKRRANRAVGGPERPAASRRLRRNAKPCLDAPSGSGDGDSSDAPLPGGPDEGVATQRPRRPGGKRAKRGAGA